MKYIFGVDFDKTNINVGLLDIDGNILEIRTILLNQQDTLYFSIDKIVLVIIEMKEKFLIDNVDVIGLGVGVPSPVLEEKIVIDFIDDKSNNYINLYETFYEKLKMHVVIENKTKLLLLGEFWALELRKYSNVLFLNFEEKYSSKMPKEFTNLEDKEMTNKELLEINSISYISEKQMVSCRDLTLNELDLEIENLLKTTKPELIILCPSKRHNSNLLTIKIGEIIQNENIKKKVNKTELVISKFGKKRSIIGAGVSVLKNYC